MTTPGAAFLESLILQTLHIQLRDDRTFTGTFICVDKQQNIILTQAEEHSALTMVEAADSLTTAKGAHSRTQGPITRGLLGGREMSMVMINGKDIVKIQVEPQTRSVPDIL